MPRIKSWLYLPSLPPLTSPGLSFPTCKAATGRVPSPEVTVRMAWMRTVTPSLQHRPCPRNVTLPSGKCSQGPGSLGTGNQQVPSDRTWSGTARCPAGLLLLRCVGPSRKSSFLPPQHISHPPLAPLCPQEPVSRTDAGSGAEGGRTTCSSGPCRLPPTQLSSPASSCSHTKPRFSHVSAQLVSGTHTWCWRCGEPPVFLQNRFSSEPCLSPPHPYTPTPHSPH